MNQLKNKTNITSEKKSWHNIQKEPRFLGTSLFGGGSLFWLWLLPILGFFPPGPAQLCLWSLDASHDQMWLRDLHKTATLSHNSLLKLWILAASPSRDILSRPQSILAGFCMMNVFCAWNEIGLISLIRTGLINRPSEWDYWYSSSLYNPRQVDSLLEYCKCTELV